LAGPTPAKTQRQLVKVDISKERQRYCSGRVNSVMKRASSSHSFFVRLDKVFITSIIQAIMVSAPSHFLGLV